MFFVSSWLIRIAFAFAFSADCSLTPAAMAQQLHSGGYSRPIRCKCSNSVASADPTADTKCQFSGVSRVSRQSFQRKICKFCSKCESYLKTETKLILLCVSEPLSLCVKNDLAVQLYLYSSSFAQGCQRFYRRGIRPNRVIRTVKIRPAR